MNATSIAGTLFILAGVGFMALVRRGNEATLGAHTGPMTSFTRILLILVGGLVYVASWAKESLAPR